MLCVWRNARMRAFRAFEFFRPPNWAMVRTKSFSLECAMPQDKDSAMPTLSINNRSFDLDVDPAMPLLWAIRDHAGLTGTKYGCGVALCGACTVHLDGEPVRACQIQVRDAVGRKVTTIEGVEGKVAKAVQGAWQSLDVVQCGYCQSGQIMNAIGLLSQNPKPSDADINNAMDAIVCRCATYVRIRAAIHQAAKNLG
jgi:isoquinoline 1-oxidoreductase alpha subunit